MADEIKPYSKGQEKFGSWLIARVGKNADRGV